MHILIYDDHNFVTEAIAAYIRQQIDTCVIYKCHTVDEVIQNLEMHDVDFIVSDVLSDEDAGFTIFEHLTKNYPDIKVVAYTSITNPFITQSLFDMGVSAVVNKKTSIASLWEQIQKIVLDSKIKTKNVVPNMYLTKREKEIATLLTKGFSAKEISDAIGSSQNTINNQKNAMLEKFDCVNSTELIVKLSQMGLLGIL
jgi:DNA-binding NarL/FixJ family response regulator